MMLSTIVIQNIYLIIQQERARMAISSAWYDPKGIVLLEV